MSKPRTTIRLLAPRYRGAKVVRRHTTQGRIDDARIQLAIYYLSRTKVA